MRFHQMPKTTIRRQHPVQATEHSSGSCLVLALFDLIFRSFATHGALLPAQITQERVTSIRFDRWLSTHIPVTSLPRNGVGFAKCLHIYSKFLHRCSCNPAARNRASYYVAERKLLPTSMAPSATQAGSSSTFNAAVNLAKVGNLSAHHTLCVMTYALISFFYKVLYWRGNISSTVCYSARGATVFTNHDRGNRGMELARELTANGVQACNVCHRFSAPPIIELFENCVCGGWKHWCGTDGYIHHSNAPGGLRGISDNLRHAAARSARYA